MFILGACGIEDYLYLEGVPAGYITVELNSKATIRLPFIDTSQFYYFTHFSIYYRIYISRTDYSTIDTSNYSTLNATLYSDYNAFLPYTDGTNTNISAVGSLFRSRNYLAVELDDANIDTVLSTSNRTITLDFIQTSGVMPVMTVGGSRSYALYRSNGGGAFSPTPNRYFFNTAELSSSENATSLINADVVPISSGSSLDRYAYVAMFIVATGMDSNFSPVYSAPTFVGVLKLPNAN
jgi:hypothetical protein